MVGRTEIIKMLCTGSVFMQFSCHSTHKFYYGKITDEKNTPLANVLVAENDTLKGRQTKKDKQGSFQLERTPHWSADLIFIKEGYKTDTIPSVWHQYGETTRFNFVKKKTPTVIRLSYSGPKDSPPGNKDTGSTP